MTKQDNNQSSNSQTGGKAASMAPINDAATAIPDNDPKIDDRGTAQSVALQNLTS
jgi:hypothetical protein